MNEVFLDTETTGLSFKEGHKVVEIACIETKDLIPTGKVFHKLINPNRSMPSEALKIHGFSEEFLKDKLLPIRKNMEKNAIMRNKRSSRGGSSRKKRRGGNSLN